WAGRTTSAAGTPPPATTATRDEGPPEGGPSHDSLLDLRQWSSSDQIARPCVPAYRTRLAWSILRSAISTCGMPDAAGCQLPSNVPFDDGVSARTAKSVPTYSVPVALSRAMLVTGRSPSGPVPLSMSVHVAVPAVGL